MPTISSIDTITRLVATTLQSFMAEPIDNLIRNQKLLAMLKSKGKMKYNVHGRFKEWTFRYKYGNTHTRSPGDTLTFDSVDDLKVVQLPWAQYYQSDSYTEEEALRNSGAAAVIKYYETKPQQLVDGLTRDIGQEIYGAGGTNKLYGFEALFGNTNSAITGTTVMNPTGTYAGQPTDLGSFGGIAGTKPWPVGKVTEAYDTWSPLILDATSTLAPTSTNQAWQNSGGWKNRCEEILSFAVTQCARNVTGKTGHPSLIMMGFDYYNSAKNTLRAKERIEVTYENYGLRKMGFQDTFMFDGSEVTAEWGLPDATVYGANLDQMGMDFEKGTMFEPEGPEWKFDQHAWVLLCRLMGQIWLNPRNMFKIAEYGSTGA